MTDLLQRHLQTLPAFRALLRAVEARFYRAVDVPAPVLDLGCGDGHFAATTFDAPLAAGIDPWWGPLQKAGRAGGHALLAQAVGDRLPFADGRFASVVSNSVLEHIPDVLPVLAEANRVLRPDGRLFVTMPNHQFTANLAGARLLDAVGGQGLGDRYRAFFNRISRHAHTDPIETWAERLAEAGFAVERWHYYFSPAALRALEWGHVQGLPSAVLHALTGHWILAPWPENLRPTERWLRPFYEEEATPDGAYQFIVARKQPRPVARPVAVHLPPPHPFTPAQLQATEPTPIPPSPPLPHSPAPLLPRSVPPPVAAPPPPSRLARALIPGSLLGLTLLSAMLGQSILKSHPADPAAGLRWYGLSLLALLGLLWRTRPAGQTVWRFPTIGQIPLRRWLVLGSLLLAAVARLFVASPPNERPSAALLTWLLAIASALFALWPPRFPIPNLQSLRHLARPLTIAAGLFIVAFTVRLLDITAHPFILNGSEASIGLDAWAAADGRFRNPFTIGWLTNPSLPFFLLAPFVAALGRTVMAVRLPSALIGALTVPAVYLIGRRVWGRNVGLVAAVLLIGSHFHLHYSRLGLTNIWDPLLVLLAIGLILEAWQRQSRLVWLAAGLAIGFNAYWYTSSHLLPLMLVGLLGLALLFERARLRMQWRGVVAAALVALVVALPQILFYASDDWAVFMERANLLAVTRNGQLDNAPDAAAFLSQQVEAALLAFNYSLDNDTTYNPGLPLLSFWPALLIVLGVGLAVLRLRRLRYGALLVWLLVTLVFGGALLENPPVSHRLVAAAPAAALLAAIALAWLGERAAALLSDRPPGSPRLTAVLLLLAALMAAGDGLFYFGRYRDETRFGDRNTEIAYEMAVYLASLDGDWTAYFYGPPSMYVSFPTIPYLAAGFQEGVNLFDIVEPGADLPAPPPGDFVLLFLPERSGELNAMQEIYPDGEARGFNGRWADPLFFAYEVRP